MPTTSEKIKENTAFVGRESEINELEQLKQLDEASVAIVYGRRRVGKTELIEQVFRSHNILKFEGVENEPEDKQRAYVMQQLALYTEQPLLRKVKIENWLDVFNEIHQVTQKGKWTIYFEEVQWLACYKEHFVSELKFAWDNLFRRNPKNIIVLCGSSPSFMIKKLLYSKSFHNRSACEIHLQAFSLQECKQFLPKKSNREIMNAYLSIGGIAEYLKRIKKYSSVFTGICQQSFLPNSFFSQEFEKIFVSSLAGGPHYKAIIDYLSQYRFATRDQLIKHLNISAGGRLTDYLDELELCGFIKKYSPYTLAESSKLIRYQINDPFLQFFFKFIQPQLKNINNGRFKEAPDKAIKMNDHQQWLGFSFERFCRNNHHLIAKHLSFAGVNYKAGAFYNRAASTEIPGYQIDLLFDRDDHVLTICEIRYLQSQVGSQIIDEFEKKLALLPNKKNKAIHKVLISAEGADQALMNRHYFDDIITLDDLFK